jgi:hypothetical protein
MIASADALAPMAAFFFIEPQPVAETPAFTLLALPVWLAQLTVRGAAVCKERIQYCLAADNINVVPFRSVHDLSESLIPPPPSDCVSFKKPSVKEQNMVIQSSITNARGNN